MTLDEDTVTSLEDISSCDAYKVREMRPMQLVLVVMAMAAASCQYGTSGKAPVCQQQLGSSRAAPPPPAHSVMLAVAIAAS